MTLIYYNTNVVQKFPEIYNHIQNSFLQNLIVYMIDSKYRKTRVLKDWLKEQVQSPSENVVALAKEITGETYDEIALNALKKVIQSIQYKSDLTVWDMSERWQTAQETLSQKTGDCEDGAILLYVLCRLRGIPSNRLMLLCGEVNGGGHCWLGYKPTNYPLNYTFMDWCYWKNINSVAFRPKFYIDQTNKIHEYDYKGIEQSSNYYKCWFGFNEDYNVKTFKYEFGRNNQ